MKDLITTLCSAWGPSGFEEEVRDLVRAEVEGLADDIMIDSMGNLIAHKHGNGQKVMLAAHLDEIGIMVNHIEDDGYLRFTKLGGVSNLNLSGTRVKFANGTIGVIFAEKRTDRGKVHGLDKHFIDVGATSKADCPIAIGDVGAFWHMPEFRGDHAISKSLDDRIGCVVLIETLRRLKK